MSNAHDIQFSGAGSMFPFLSVMFCTIGVLALLLVAGSLEAAGESGETDTRLARARTLDGDLAREERAANEALSREETRTTVARATSDELQRLADLRAKNAASRARQQALMARVSEARSKVAEANAIPEKTELAAQLAAVEGTLASARELVRMLTAEVDKLTAEGASLGDQLRAVQEAGDRGRVVITARGELADRRPALIELDRDAAVVHSLGLGFATRARVTGSALAGDAGLLSAFARRVARPDDRRYAVVLVRPGSAKLYGRLAEQLVAHRAVFVAEPVDAGVGITFEE